MSNSSEQMNLSGITCTSCGESVAPGTRAVVFLNVVWHRVCWLAEEQKVQPTALERRAGRNWPRVGRCRVSA